MGNMKSCCLQFCPPNKENEDPHGERTHILRDPTDEGSNENDFYINNSNETNYGTMDHNSKNHQTNKWNRTLQKMTVNVIDVSTAYVPAMEQSELLERQKVYTNKIINSKIVFTLKNKLNRQRRLQRKTNLDAKKLQITESINVDDILFMNQLSDKIADAVMRGFQIDVKDELVVQFNP